MWPMGTHLFDAQLAGLSEPLDQTCCAFRRLGSLPLGDPHPKSSQYRFLCWVTLHRTLDTSIDSAERLSCPLSSCKASFGDGQFLELVSHVSSCPYLVDGLYRCPYCLKEESFWWELTYPIDAGSTSEPTTSGTIPNLNPYPATTEVAATAEDKPDEIMSGPSRRLQDEHQYSNYIEFDTEHLPEISYSEYPQQASLGRPGSQAQTGVTDPDPFGFAEFANEPLPQTMGLVGQTFEMPFELPSGTDRDTSRRATPLQAHSPLPFAGPVSPQFPQPWTRELNFDVLSETGDPPISPGLSAQGISRSTTAFGGFSLPGQQGELLQPPRRASNQPIFGIGTDAWGTVSEGMSERAAQKRPISSQSRQGSRQGSKSPAPSASGPATSPIEATQSSVTCDICGKVLRGKVAYLASNLNRHHREIHRAPVKQDCKICGRSFNRGHNLKHHMRAVHASNA